MEELMLRIKVIEDHSCMKELSPELQRILEGPIACHVKWARNRMEMKLNKIPVGDLVTVGKILKDFWQHLPCVERYL